MKKSGGAEKKNVVCKARSGTVPWWFSCFQGFSEVRNNVRIQTQTDPREKREREKICRDLFICTVCRFLLDRERQRLETNRIELEMKNEKKHIKNKIFITYSNSSGLEAVQK